MRRHGNETAFTLVELLVVIGVIGILAALLLAGMSQVKSRVHRIQCANNVRQLGLALQEFRTDHHFYPPAFDPTVQDEVRYWKSALGNEMGIHLKSEYIPKGVWRCPSASRPANIPENLGYDDYGYNVIGLGAWSYTRSLGLSDYWVDGLRMPPRQPHHVMESEIASPSELIAIGDAMFGGPNIIHDGGLFGRAGDASVLESVADGDNSILSTKRSRVRHQGQANVVFCDGHVESPSLKYLFADPSDGALSRWNRDHQPHRERLLQ